MRLPRFLSLALLLLPLLALAGCGDLPEPFLGNPGPAAMILRQPPAPRLSIAPPAQALLDETAARSFADAMAAALEGQEVPAYAQPAAPTDWRLAITAQIQAGMVVPHYVVLDPRGKSHGAVDGPGVSEDAWSSSTPITLARTALAVAPKIAGLLNNIETGLMKADPNSLYNRPAKVDVAPVTGAPGDGDQALTAAMRIQLAGLGPKVQTDAKDADFIVQGQVRIVPIAGGQQRVEIQWIVTAPGTGPTKGERGRVVQLNDVPAGSLDHAWGAVADAVAIEASKGLNEVILRQSRRK